MSARLTAQYVLARSLQVCTKHFAGPCLTILIFHRVLERADPLFPGEMHAQRFDRLMEFVARTYRVLTLRDSARRLANSELPPRALAITFDDGYADNASIALPILRRHGLVATFFISTGFLDGGLMWNDAVIESVRSTTLASIDLEAFGLTRMMTQTVAQRRAAVEALLPRLKYLEPGMRDDAVMRLSRGIGVSRLPSDLMMQAVQVQQLSRAGMEIGAHTVNHPILTSVPLAVAEGEIRAGRERLQELIDAPVDSFAYPNGRPREDYDGRHVAIVRRLGFAAAVSTAAGVARIGADLFELPRYSPWDQSNTRWMMRMAMAPLLPSVRRTSLGDA